MAGTTVGKFNLRIPLDDEVAEVPKDMEDLAITVNAALDLMLPKTEANTTYQPRIEVVVGTTPPASKPEGTVVFLIAP